LNAIIRLDSGSLLRLGEPRADQPQNPGVIANLLQDPIEYCLSTINQQWLRLQQGALRLFTTEPQRLRINTPYMNASIEGTEFFVSVSAKSTRVDVVQGSVAVCNAAGSVEDKNRLLKDGESAESINGGPPVLVTPRGAAQWALHFPKLSPSQTLAESSSNALQLLQHGQADSAIGQLENSQEAFDLALHSLIRITLNELEEAKSLSDDAIMQDNKEPTAWLARSYVEQANFELEEALKSLRQAHLLDLSRTDIQARLAEVLLATGREREAFDLAVTSVDRSPNIGRLQAVLGLLQLGRYEMHSAKQSFNTARELDPEDPIPRFGLALAHMRTNQVPKALQEMQLAVNLQPNSSLLRSYLGRLYLELGRMEEAAEQLTLANQFDPNDPTPLLFSALLSQRQGQPVMALTDLKQSETLVNRRAVYRSRASLDEDFAVALASRARIYQELGFSELARLDGMRSLQRDPGSYVGHRLMADFYLNRPRRELARQSEILQAQILQPLNNNPSQLRVADQNLSAFRDSGPFGVSLGEYNRLFTREGINRRIGIRTGSNNSKDAETQFAGLKNNTSIALSGFFSRTDGIDVNRDGRTSIVAGNLHQRVNNQLDLQLQLEKRTDETGDFSHTVTREVFDRNGRTKIKRNGLRLSAFFRPMLTKGNIFEVQHRKKATNQNVHLGLIATQEQQDFQKRVFSLNPSNDTTSRRNSVTESNVYGYRFSTFYSPHFGEVDSTIGLSLDSSHGRNRNKLSLNPKLGLGFKKGKTYWRAAAFRGSRRSILAARSLEPGNIMGFAQTVLQNLVNASTVVGVGVDTETFTHNSIPESGVSTGAEISLRKTDHTRVNKKLPRSTELEFQAYTHVTSQPYAITISARTSSWRSNEIELETQRIGQPRARTIRIDLDLRRYWKSGLSISFQPQYIYQRGRFYNFTSEPTSESKDAVVVVNLAINLNLNRYLGRFSDGILSFTGANIFDRAFSFQDEEPTNPSIAYERHLTLKVQLTTH